MIKDRVMKKWRGIMLEEHIALYMEFNVDQKRVPKPELDEYDLHAIEKTIEMAMKRSEDVLLDFWVEGKIDQSGGIVKSIDISRRTIKVENPYGLFAYSLDDIIDASILE
ncbi:YolD-like family protein [Psychrobacillus sp.]|uniref:YolD-like family protein n=1 Tax=Psychrobacillus sp. TaxID=1871623 RepID=UPI0028BE55F8|nr:YolD-like family protein [Psychrobacillus sp.]